MRPGQGLGGIARGLKHPWVGSKCLDRRGDLSKRFVAHPNAVLGKDPDIARLLAGNGAKEDQRQVVRQRFGDRQSAGLGNHDVGCGHHFLHVVHKAANLMKRIAPGRHFCQKGFVVSTDDNKLNVLKKPCQLLDRAEAEGTCRKQGREFVLLKAKPTADLTFVARTNELFIDRDTGHKDLFLIHPQGGSPALGIVAGDQKDIHALHIPDLVNIVIRDDRHKLGVDLARAPQPAAHFRRKKMCGHDDVKVPFFNEFDERPGVKMVVNPSDRTEDRLEPRLIGQLKKDGPKLRQLADHKFITLAIGLAKERACVDQSINDLGGNSTTLKTVVDRLGGLTMPGPGCRMQEQDLL